MLSTHHLVQWNYPHITNGLPAGRAHEQLHECYYSAITRLVPKLQAGSEWMTRHYTLHLEHVELAMDIAREHSSARRGSASLSKCKTRMGLSPDRLSIFKEKVVAEGV